MRHSRELPPLNPIGSIHQELEYLYLRRSTIESLIRALEQYESCRPKSKAIRRSRPE
jgi:hypothetical protein